MRSTKVRKSQFAKCSISSSNILIIERKDHTSTLWLTSTAPNRSWQTRYNTHTHRRRIQYLLYIRLRYWTDRTLSAPLYSRDSILLAQPFPPDDYPRCAFFARQSDVAQIFSEEQRVLPSEGQAQYPEGLRCFPWSPDGRWSNSRRSVYVESAGIHIAA